MGQVHGALELSADYVPVLNPVTNTASQVPLTVRDLKTPPTNPAMPSRRRTQADEVIWTSKNNVHNPMLDHEAGVAGPRRHGPQRIRLSARPARATLCETLPRGKRGRHLASTTRRRRS